MKMRVILFFLLLLNQNVLAQFFWSNPSIQNNTLRDIGYFNNSILYAVGDLGTILTSSDYGKTWNISHRFLGLENDLYSIDFTDENNGWICGTYGLIIRTFDGTQSWQIQSSPTYNHLRKVFALRWDKAWIVGEKGTILYASNGYSFVSQNSPVQFNLNSVYFIDENNGFIVGDSGVLLRTFNAGNNWQVYPLPQIKKNINDILFTSTTRGYAVGDSGLILRTTNGGISWHIIGQDVTQSDLKSLFFLDDLRGFVIGKESRIFYTSDGGNNWTFQYSPTWRTLYSSYFFSSTIGVAVGDWGTILRTTNGGNGWLQLNRGSDEYLNKSFFINENIGWVAGEKGTILKTTNGGLSWYRVLCWNRWNQFMTADINAIQMFNESQGYAIGDSGYFGWTSDGGENWRFYHYDSSNRMDDLFGLHFFDQWNGWVVGGYWSQPVFLKTTNGGQSWHIWRPSDQYYAAVPLHIQMLNYSNGWASCRTGVLRYTTNGGDSWQYYDPNILGFGDWLNWIKFVNPNVGWTCGKAGKIFKTTNSGLYWFEQFSGTSKELMSINFYDENLGFAVGREGIILRTTDGGENWIELPRITRNDLKSIFIVNNQIAYISGDLGLILKTTNGGITFVEDLNPLSKNFELYQNYPNPFNSITKIRFIINYSGKVKISVYNSMGELITTLIDNEMIEGQHEVYFNAKSLNYNLPSGVYFFRLETNKFNKTIKSIYLK